MENFKKLIAFMLLSLASASLLYAQNGVQAGLFSPSGNTLTVRARPEFTLTNKSVSGIIVTLRWLKSYGINFTPATGSFGVSVQDSGSDATYNYKIFGAVPVGQFVTWAAGSENDLFSVQVINGTGTGSFELTNAYVGKWYFEIGGVDSTDPTPFYLQSVGNVTLPIQLSSFVASVAAGGQAGLRWTTLSEINNYGFEVQKAADKSATFQTISGSFTPGNGTTTVKHDYSYVDKSYATGNVYRLKQLELDGTANFTDPADPLGVTGVAGRAMPTVYSLSQNYPNPFNPSTRISFATTKEGPVSLKVYDVLGREVATLVNDNRKPGQYTELFDGRRVASGVYVYVLRSAEGQLTSRMILSK
jgi:hypothetical protein